MYVDPNLCPLCGEAMKEKIGSVGFFRTCGNKECDINDPDRDKKIQEKNKAYLDYLEKFEKTSKNHQFNVGEIKKMLGHKEKLKNGGECDVVSGWKRVLCYCQRAGVTKKIKQKMRRRFRHGEQKETKKIIYEEIFLPANDISHEESSVEDDRIEAWYMDRDFEEDIENFYKKNDNR
jgi:hypothetical protein